MPKLSKTPKFVAVKYYFAAAALLLFSGGNVVSLVFCVIETAFAAGAARLRYAARDHATVNF